MQKGPEYAIIQRLGYKCNIRKEAGNQDLERSMVINMEMIILGGGLLVIIVAVIIAAVTSVVAGVAASEEDSNM